MARDTRTTAQKNRAVRQKAIREQLEAQGHLQYAVEIIEKLEDAGTKLDSSMIQRYKAALEARFKLIGKYLPDMRSIEHTGEINHAHRAADLGDDELANIATGGSERTAEEADSKAQLH